MEEVNADSNALVRGINSFSSKNWQSTGDDGDSALWVRLLKCDWLTSFSPGLEAYSLIFDTSCQVDTATTHTTSNQYMIRLPPTCISTSYLSILLSPISPLKHRIGWRFRLRHVVAGQSLLGTPLRICETLVCMMKIFPGREVSVLR